MERNNIEPRIFIKSKYQSSNDKSMSNDQMPNYMVFNI